MKKVELVDFNNGFGLLIDDVDKCLVHYLDIPELNVPEPEWPCTLEQEDEKEEYRLYISDLDDTTGMLLRNLSTKYAKKWNLSFKDAYRLLTCYWGLGYKIHELLDLSPIELEKFLHIGLIDEILRLYDNLEEEMGDFSREELEEYKNEEFLPDFLLNVFVIYSRVKNFTGEVRLKECTSEEDIDSNSIEEGDNVEFIKHLKSIVTCIKGKQAYYHSKVALSLSSDPSKRKLIQKAWETRKSLPHNATLEERLEAARKIFV